MITKLHADHVVKTGLCGEIHEILTKPEYSPNIAVAFDIKPTTAHYHTNFDEIYFALDGSITLQTYDPGTNLVSQQTIAANELCVITKGIHHRIIQSSEKNRLCVISVPHFDANDEHISEQI